jgi:phosphotransacetylase
MLVAGLISSVLGNKLPGAGTVYRRQDIRFHRPVCAGDTVTASVTVREKRPADHAVVLECRCVNQDNEEILTGTAEVVAPREKLHSIVRERSDVRVRRHDKYDRLIARAKTIPAVSAVVAHPCDETSLRGAVEAAEAGMIVPILVGPEAKIRSLAEQYKLDIGRFEVVDAAHSHAAASKAVELIRAGRGEVLMKGSLHSDELLRAVAERERGLRTERRISHVFIMDVPTYEETLFITDAAVNIFPDLDGKRDILQNAIDLHVALIPGVPRVAILSAVETVTAKIPGTIDAAALCKMADRGQIVGALVDGPLALDNAISMEAARIKGIKSEVAGRAQILLVPDLEAGNMLAKNLSFLANADAAGIVLGARVPIVLTSRADTVRTRMASCAVAALYAAARHDKTAIAAE